MTGTLVSPPHGGVDRNTASATVSTRQTVAPSRGRGSKRRIPREGVEASASPPHGGVDRNV